MAFKYLLFGYRVASEFDLGGKSIQGDSPAPRLKVLKSDKKIKNSEVRWYHRTRDESGHFFSSYGVHRGSYCIRLHGEVDFLISKSGDRIECLSSDRVAVRKIEAHLLSFVIPFALTLQGSPVLHAAAIRIKGKAVGFIGTQGRGKSTLTAAFVKQKFSMMSDDALPLRLKRNSVVAYPSFPEIRLRKKSVQHFFGADKLSNARLAFRKKRTRVDESFSSKPARLDCLFVLENGSKIRFEKVEAKDAWFILLNNCYRIDPGDRKLVAGEFDTYSRMAAKVPVVKLFYPRKMELLPGVIKAVLRHIQS